MRRNLFAYGAVFAVLMVLAAATSPAATRRPAHVRTSASTGSFWKGACQLFEAAHGPELALDVLGKALLGGGDGYGAIATALLGDDPLRCGEYQISVPLPDFESLQGIIAQEMLHSSSWSRFRSWLAGHAGHLRATTPGLAKFSRPLLGITDTVAAQGLPGPFRLVPLTVSWSQVAPGPVDVEIKAVHGTTDCYLFRRVTPVMGANDVASVGRTITVAAGTTWQVGIRAANSGPGCTLFDGSAFRWAPPSTVSVSAAPTATVPVRFSGSELAIVGNPVPNAASFSITRTASDFTVPVRFPDGPATLWFLQPGPHRLSISLQAVRPREIYWLSP